MTSDFCTKCEDGSNRSGPKCECVEGFYEDNKDICPQCNVHCETCDDNTKCTSCPLNSHRELD